MTATTLNPFQQARIIFRDRFKKGIKPTDPRQPIEDELALEMVQELKDLDVPTDALIGVYDAFMILSTHLKEAGYTNLVLLENMHKNLTSLQKEYYTAVEQVCENSNIKYYVPPMNNYNRCDMKFDVIIGNPPYQSANGGGDKRGSTTNPLWWQITKTSLTLLKKDGILSFITPTNIVNGGDSFTKIFLGSDRKYDLNTVDFTAGDSFKVGIPICRWVVANKLTADNNVIVTDGRVLDTSDTLKISPDKTFDEILNRVFHYDGEKLKFNVANNYDFRMVARHIKKLNFNTEKRYDFQNVARDLEKQDLPTEWAKDLTLTRDDVHQYPVNINGKIKYSRIKWKNNGTPRLFIAKMQNPLKVEYSSEWEADGSTFTMVFDSEEDARITQSYLTNPIYMWIIEQTRVSGRVNGTTISKLPNAPIEQVLTADQLSYIQSQL